MNEEHLQVTTSGKASVLLDMQFGSTGKGLFAAYLAGLPRNHCDISVTNAGPNAGHTTCFADGRKFVTFHLPTFGVIQEKSIIFLDAGSIIDPDMLQKELSDFSIDPMRIFVHPRAAVIEPDDRAYEHRPDAATSKLSGTQKGVGRAIARKVMREAKLADEHPFLKQFVRPFSLNDELHRGKSAFIEVPQGFGLSLNDGLSYPYCTSRNISVSQALADAGLHPSKLYKVIGVQRSKPIRVGNLKDECGKEIGYSGPCYPDQKELSWEELGQAPEYTTVTKRVRRVFTWSEMQYEHALKSIRPDIIFNNFVNYNKTAEEVMMWDSAMYSIEKQVLGHSIPKMWGVGPNVENVVGLSEVMDHMGWAK